MLFEWDDDKNKINIQKHNIAFEQAQKAFLDKNRIIALDVKHSHKNEKRYFCFGKVNNIVITVRFTFRYGKIRIFGAGIWREGRRKYEDANKI